jgi:3-keto-disaccharide hydrolase
MKRFSWILFAAACAASAADDDGFVPLFNGRDLTGWVNANCAPETWTVQEGMIHCTGRPTGALRTTRQYENFILEVDWRHLSRGGNSGVFIWGTPIAAPGVPFLRGIEVQVLDHGYAEQYEKQNGKKSDWFTTHGDVFPIHGATMKPFGRHRGDRNFPSEERSKGSPEWNHYRIVCSNGVLRLHVNGKEVSGGEECNYRKGYLALESEGAPVEFRDIRIKELPSSDATPAVTAPVDLGWRAMFTGLDLRRWKTNAATALRWQISGERLALREGAADAQAALWTEEDYGDAEFILDCRPAKRAPGEEVILPTVQLRGANGQGTEVKLEGVAAGSYQRFVITVKGRDVTVKRNAEQTQRVTIPASGPARGAFGLRDTGGAMDFMNLYVRDL